MKYQAVIFDLFGTLADNFSSREYEEALKQMAAVLAVSPDDFKQGWYGSSRVRNSEAPTEMEARIEYICTKLGAAREKRHIKDAATARFDYIRRVMEPRKDAVEVISYLKRKGHKIGLISDCSDEIPVIWPKNPLACLFDATVFSCLAGIRKPDPRIYGLATNQLGVPFDSCLYIGDGGSQELTGAEKVGMHSVLFRLDGDSTEQNLVSREEWNGLRIRSFREILTIVEEDRLS
jgi:putative hydrolase of the HAD superfamily